MRLLFITQIVDQNDPVLGFVHHWLEVFSTRFEHIHVICLKEGAHTLPKNVTVHSLGKEKGGNRFLYAVRFIKLVYALNKEYDSVFVHMNPEYIALAGDLWRMSGKRIGLWYNHQVGSVWLRLAQPFVQTVFHTSPYAYPARYKNAKQMPAGIDTELFSPKQAIRKPHSIYFQGRIAPAKRVHVLLEAVRLLRAQGIPATASLVGPEDPSYGAMLRTDFKDLIEAGAVAFLGPKQNEETPVLYASHAVAINLTADGNFDKTVLEAAATETPVLIASRAFSGTVPDAWVLSDNSSQGLTEKLKELFALPKEPLGELAKGARKAVIEKHSLAVLASELARSYDASAQ
jgi:glycosyltransferase involved in cell wall biosynthesis